MTRPSRQTPRPPPARARSCSSVRVTAAGLGGVALAAATDRLDSALLFVGVPCLLALGVGLVRGRGRLGHGLPGRHRRPPARLGAAPGGRRLRAPRRAPGLRHRGPGLRAGRAHAAQHRVPRPRAPSSRWSSSRGAPGHPHPPRADRRGRAGGRGLVRRLPGRAGPRAPDRPGGRPGPAPRALPVPHARPRPRAPASRSATGGPSRSPGASWPPGSRSVVGPRSASSSRTTRAGCGGG